MNRDEIRAKIKERLKTGALPRYSPPLTRIGGGEAQAPTPAITIGPAPGRPCSACDRVGADIKYSYPDRDIAFHQECDTIWQEERQKPTVD